jgi:hypothetical protein
VIRISTIGIVTFGIGTAFSWHSKRQNTIEASLFGAEFWALRIGTEFNEPLQYKLRMIEVPNTGPTNTFCDIETGVKNVSKPRVFSPRNIFLSHITKLEMQLLQRIFKLYMDLEM